MGPSHSAFSVDNNFYYYSKQIFLSFHWPRAYHVTCNNCLQIMVCSCAMPSNCVWLQIIFCTCVKETVLFSFLRSLLRENGRSLRFPRILITKTSSVIAKYRYLSVSRKSDFRLWQIIDLLATGKSRYFAQPRPTIVIYSDIGSLKAKFPSGRVGDHLFFGA